MRVVHEYTSFDGEKTHHGFEVAKEDVKQEDVILTDVLPEDFFGMMRDCHRVGTPKKRFVNAKDVTYVKSYVVCPLCDKEIVVKLASKKEEEK